MIETRNTLSNEELEGLIAYATERQEQIIKSRIKHKHLKECALDLGISEREVRRSIQRVKKTAANHGYIPSLELVRPSPSESGLKMTGASIYRDGIWHKFEKEKKDTQDMIKEALEEMKKEIKPLKPIKKTSKKNKKELLNLYMLTDSHIGMLAWGEECGEDYDLKKAKELIVRSFEYLIDNSPEAEVAVFCQNGDYAHYDSMDSVTPLNKHQLDADSRPQKMIRACIWIMRQVIELLAKKYKKVIVMANEGNHDPVGSAWMRELLSALYSGNKRIEVITHPRPYHAIEWGKNMLGFHHGHLAKKQRLADVFMTDYREMYGRTELLHIHTGHFHHRELKETNTYILEVHATLAAKDAYAARGGWRADRMMQVITYHKDFKETSRNIVRPEMV